MSHITTLPLPLATVKLLGVICISHCQTIGYFILFFREEAGTLSAY